VYSNFLFFFVTISPEYMENCAISYPRICQKIQTPLLKNL